jgi:hypothetical protein
LLIGCEDLLPNVGQPLPYHRIRQSGYDSGVDLRYNLLRSGLWREYRLPIDGLKAWQTLS